MLVIDENRLMGPSPEQLSQLERMIRRDRNHPSVILWSLGNEEWDIEGNIKGARIAATMQASAQRLDPTRRITVANSGGWGGISTVIDVVGYNYIKQSDTDGQHAKFPNQPGVGTEETTTRATRGIYVNDPPNAHLAPAESSDSGRNCETGWKHYAARPYLAGVFFWTGFDYRGEPNPFGWPQAGSQSGILDTCGFPKDSFYYLKSWWTDQPVLHLFPHWNWPGREGQEIAIQCDSNCDEIELSLNGRSLGRKTLERNSHLEWKVRYAPGTLLAQGFRNGREIASDRVETTGVPAAVRLLPDRPKIRADGEDVSVITVQVLDAQGRVVPTADNPIAFNLEGPARIIGVGNGDPSSHEPDRYVERVSVVPVGAWRMHAVEDAGNRPEVAFVFDDSSWPAAFAKQDTGNSAPAALQSPAVWRGVFEMPEATDGNQVSLLLRQIGEQQSVYINGQALSSDARRDTAGLEFALAPGLLRPGRNVIAIVAIQGLPRPHEEVERLHIHAPAIVHILTPAGQWQRSVFNGLAQVIVQSERQAGEITLAAKSPNLSSGAVQLEARPAAARPAVPAE
jgi:beta-galactosidase